MKTTNGHRDFPFYLSANEVEVSAILGHSFKLYRVFDFSTAPHFYVVAGDLRTAFNLSPRVFEARRSD